MDTVSAIFWTQLPIVVVIFVGVYELYRIKVELLAILRKLSKKEIIK